jgi:hypothetical protein
MPVKKTRKAPQKKFSTKMKQAPVKTLRQEFNKMGIIGKGATIGLIAGAVTPAAAQELDRIPVAGRFFRIFTSYGQQIARRLR